MVTEIKKQNWFVKHWIISILLGFVVMSFINGVINGIPGENDSGITGNIVNEQSGQLQMNLYTAKGGLEEFPSKVRESIENSEVFDYWKSTNKEKANFLYYNSEDYQSLLDMLQSENLKDKFEETCGNKLTPDRMIVSDEGGVILNIRVSDGETICDVVLTEPTEEVNSCTPNWNCDSWFECSSAGVQTRNCTDSNNCGTASGRPSESQSCAYQYKLGDRVVVDDVAYTINSKTENSQVGKSYVYGDYESFMGTTADGIFYIFDLTVENVGMESKTLWGTNIKIYDSQGRSFDHDSMAEIYLDDSLQYDQLQPGLPKRGKIVFDVPKGLTGKLEISSTEFFSDNKEYVSWE
ncbi:MAG: DUF4352 domain-containing protein [Nanoarchaeota archaeon]|nr:DUF4352 domain-containing protein [Nanoarchaeota archaeon]MBU1501174.1 DUF4352 domain-containing protein [Nanoarchaeota archaeon]